MVELAISVPRHLTLGRLPCKASGVGTAVMDRQSTAWCGKGLPHQSPRVAQAWERRWDSCVCQSGNCHCAKVVKPAAMGSRTGSAKALWIKGFGAVPGVCCAPQPCLEPRRLPIGGRAGSNPGWRCGLFWPKTKFDDQPGDHRWAAPSLKLRLGSPDQGVAFFDGRIVFVQGLWTYL